MGAEHYYPSSSYLFAPQDITSSYSYTPMYTYAYAPAQPVKRPVGWLTRAARRTNKRPL